MSCGCGCGGEVVAYEDWNETDVTAAEYQGRKVTLNKPFRTPGASKNLGVYTTNEKGNVVLVRFGDPIWRLGEMTQKEDAIFVKT